MLQFLMDVLLGALAAEVGRLLDGLGQIFDAVLPPPFPFHALADQMEELLQRLWKRWLSESDGGQIAVHH